jgi:hypothetical protein
MGIEPVVSAAKERMRGFKSQRSNGERKDPTFPVLALRG